jgi:hypothetical protein
MMYRSPALVLCVLASAAHASILVSEPFAYPDGNLVGNGGWAAHSGAGVIPVLVTSGRAQLAQGSGTREDANLALTPAGAGAVYYAGFDLTNSAGATAVYFAHFMTNATTFNTRLFVVPAPASGGDYGLGLSNSSTTPMGAAVWATGLSFGSTNRVIVSYNYDTGEQRLWLNPVDVNSPSISVSGAASAAINAFGLRQSGGDSTQLIDNLAVATTFGEVVD